MTMKRAIRRLLHPLGYDIHKLLTDRLELTHRLLREHQVGLVIDVGANEGQFATELRRTGYSGLVWSFEPGREAFHQLWSQAKMDPNWKVVQAAIGDEDDDAILHIAANSVSSSLLPMTPLHEAAARKSRYVHEEVVRIRPLDEFDLPECPTVLKIDTQGYELKVLRGAPRTLARQTVAIQLEVSLATLYEGQPGYRQIDTFLSQRGFRPIFVEPAMQDSVGRMLQLDMIYERAAS